MNTKRSAYVLGPALGRILFAFALLILPASLSPAQANQIPLNTLLIAKQGSSLSNSSIITIGVAADLSGGASTFGWQEANSVQLAINQTNAAGGINIGGTTYTLALVTADSPCGDDAQAITAANTLLTAGAKAVVGHTCSGNSLAAESVYNAAGVAMISPSSTNPQVTQQGYITTFRTVSHDGTPPTLLATYFRNWLGLTKSAIVVTSDPYLSQRADIYSNTFTSLGGTITSRRVANTTSDFPAVLNAIKTENPDAIVYFNYGDPAEGGQFSLTAYGLGMTNTVIGWSSWTNDESPLTTYATTAGAAAAENDYAAMQYRRFQDMPGWTTFLAAYQSSGFPHEPSDPGVYGAYAYDAARIIIAAIDRADSTNPADIRNQIAATSNYAGVVGTYQGFDANGDVIPQWAWLERYQSGQWVILPETGAQITSSNTASGTNPSTTTGGSTGITANATGVGIVTVGIYNSNPGGTPSFSSSGAYMDVHVAPGNTFTSLTIVDCNLYGGTQVDWWNGTTWALASNQSYNSSTVCVTITVNNSTSPSLNQLTGTPFGAAGGFKLFLPLILR